MNEKQTPAQRLITACEQLEEAVSGPEGIANYGYTTISQAAKQEDWSLLETTLSGLEDHIAELIDLRRRIDNAILECQE